MAAHQILQAQQHVFRYKTFLIEKNNPLGHGSYGAVYKAKCDQLPCAAKILHPILVDPTNLGQGSVVEKFQQECRFLENIRHPNIVQYLGMTTDPDSGLPVLLMELLDESLTNMLKHSQQLLSFSTEVDICHDIALAVAYLHSNDVIHRDLSSNNVLMIARKRAKVTDFGVSKLAGTKTSQSKCPGTLAYMPPEALSNHSRYTTRLDCFSEGVIMIQVCTRLWPDPGPEFTTRPDPTSQTGEVRVPVLETERRKNHIDVIDPTHALLPIAKDCLNYQESKRPSSEELCQRLAAIKESTKYKNSVEKGEIQVIKDQIPFNIHQEVLQEKEQQLRRKENRIHEQEELLQQKENELQEEKRHVSLLRQQLRDQEIITAEIQQTNDSLQRRVEQLQQQLSQQNQALSHSSPPYVQAPYVPPLPMHAAMQQQRPHPMVSQSLPPTMLRQPPPDHNIMRPLPLPQNQGMKWNWRYASAAPVEMRRGSAVVNGDIAYFLHYDGKLCSYSSANQKWKYINKYRFSGGSLVVISGQLTAIGGCGDVEKRATYTNKLFTLLVKRKPEFPPMLTSRSETTTVAIDNHVIVAGGTTGPSLIDNVDIVEVMDISSLSWSSASSLPHPFCNASACICEDQLYMLGGYDSVAKSKSVLMCSLAELVRSSSLSLTPVWRRITDIPSYMYLTTCISAVGELLAFGGRGGDSSLTAAIHKYNRTTRSWDVVGYMPTARWYSLVVALPTYEIMIVGGSIGPGYNTNIVELGTFTLNNY